MAYHQYSEAERRQVAMERWQRLVGAVGELDAQKTFLIFAWHQLGVAGAHKDAEAIEQVVANLGRDIDDVEKVAERFCAVWREVLEAIAKEYRETAAEGKL